MSEPRTDDPRIAATIVVGVVGALLVVLSVLGLETLYYRTADAAAMAREAGRPNEYLELRAAEERLLSGYRWVDRAHGVVAIPVERAMELVEREQGMRRPAEPSR